MSPISMDSPLTVEPRSMLWSVSGSVSTSASTPCSNGADLLPPPTTSAPFTFLPSTTNAMPSLERTSTLQTSPSTTARAPISPPISLSNHCLTSMASHPSITPPPIDPRLSSPLEPPFDHKRRSVSVLRQSPSCANIDGFAEQDHEIAYLLRWFSEGPAYWMDLFDLGTYFASYVPVKARENPLLKYAAVAYAAKALARVQGRKPVVGGSVTRQARMELHSNAQSVDWYHKAAQYYDTAVSLLLQALKDDSTMSPNSELDYEPRATCWSQGKTGRSPKRRRTSSAMAFKSNTDELLAASAILCVYEFLDASVPEWAKHLNGAKSLLVIAQERMMPLQVPTPGSTISTSNLGFTSKARRATFWNIARQDMLAAFINKTHTRLDTEDLSLWKEAGLRINDNGFILPSNTTESGYPEGEDMMKEDLICNALVWLMAKLVNFMATGDELPVEVGRTSWAGVPQRTLLDYWHYLKQQFATWHDGLPVTFRPVARIEPSASSARGYSDMLFSEIWYSIPMCASTMQCYHMSQIQLLMNKPHESTQGRTNVFARMNSYQSVLAASQVHSREIIGISLARSDEAVRIHSVQPLFTAGQCLHDPREQQVVLDLLRDIETDIGWATDYRVQQLIQQWKWEGREELHVT